MRKPNFEGERSAAFSWGTGNLTDDERASLVALVPKSWFDATTRDVRCETDAARLLRGADEALGFFDANGGAITATGNAVLDGIESIARAARALQLAIRNARKTARVAIDSEAVYSVAPLLDDVLHDPLSVRGQIAVHWFQTLRSMGHTDIAFAIQKSQVVERRTYSFLEALWDLASDASQLAERASAGVKKGTHIRPDRVNAEAMAHSIVASIGRNLGRCLPKSPWAADFVGLVASFRGVTVGKQIGLRAIRHYAGRHQMQTRQTG